METDILSNLNKVISRKIRKDLKKFNTNAIQITIEKNKNMKVMRRRMAEGRSNIFKLEDSHENETTNRQRILEITERES